MMDNRSETATGSPSDAVAPATSIAPALASAIARVRRTLNVHIALDAMLSGLAVGALVASPGALLCALLGWPLGLALALGALGLVLVAVREARRRWHDPLDAALALDRLFDAKDRFSTALQFAREPSPPPLHRLQIAEAGEFFSAHALVTTHRGIPTPPRPPYRVGRYATAAVVTLGLSAPLAYLGEELRAWLTNEGATASSTGAPSPEEIAAAADALRSRLRDDPNRRLDADINALEHALSEQRERATEERADAIREAAELLERALGVAQGEASQGRDGDSTAPREELASPPSSVEAEPPPYASRRLLEAWERAREAREAWRRAASEPSTDAVETARLQRDAQDRQLEAIRLARQEAAWQASQPDGSRPGDSRPGDSRPAEATGSAEDRLGDAVERLDRALAQLHREDGQEALPSAAVGQALSRAAERLGERAPRTSRAMQDAERARARNDAERMDLDVERARQALRREAGAEPQEFGDARRRLDELHDEVARRAAERAEREQLAQNGASERGQAQGQQGQAQGQQGQAQGQQGQAQGQQGQAQGQQGQAQGQQGQAQGQQGQAQGQQGQAQGQQGQAQGQQGQAQGQQGQGQGQGQGQQGQGQGQQGQGQQGQGQGQGQGQQGQGQGQGQPGQGQGQQGQGQQGQGQGQPGGGVGGGAAQGMGRGQGAAQLGGGQGIGQTPGEGQGHQPGTGRGSASQAPGGESQRANASWGSGSGSGAAGAEVGPAGSGLGVNADPGVDGDPGAQLAPDARAGGMLQGESSGTGRGGTPMDGRSGAEGGEGDGSLAPEGDDGPRVTGDTTVPASLRAYVRRYLERIRDGERASP